MKAPWHLWVVGVVTLLWNAIGAFDYVMTKLQSESYMAAFTPEQLEFFYGFPAWVTVAWAVAVWFSVLGSVLLLMRSRHSVIVFAIAFFAMVVTSLHNFVLSDVTLTDIAGPMALWFSAAIFVVAALLVFYARSQNRRGVLS